MTISTRSMFACGLYLIVGPLLILMNKYILNDLNFPFPGTLSTFGMATSSIITWFLVHKAKLVKLQHRGQIDRYVLLRKIAPVGLCSVGTLYCGNEVYRHLSVSLIQMLKAFTPAVVVFLLYIFRVSRPTNSLVCAVALVCTGTALTCSGNVEASVTGLTFMFLSSVFESLKQVLSQILLSASGMKFSVLEGLYYLAPATCLWFVLVLLPALELRPIYEQRAWTVVVQNPGIFLLVSLLGFVVNVASLLVLQTSSALVLKLLATGRNLSLIALSILYYGDPTSVQEFVGFAAALGGFVWLNWLKINKKAEIAFERKERAAVVGASAEKELA